MAALKDSAFEKRRTILGLTVLVHATADADGICRETFPVRIKRPDGDEDFRVQGHYYWQAFNAAKKHILSCAR